MLKYRALVIVWSGLEPQTTFSKTGHMFEEDTEKERALIASYFNGKVTVEFEILMRDCTPFD